MLKALDFNFVSPKYLVLFVVMLVIFVLAYHQVIQNSIRNHPESTRRAVQEHCRYMLGKKITKMPEEEFVEKFHSCSDVRIKSVTASGGVFNPVIVKITVERQNGWPLESDVFIFKTADINTGKSLDFLSGFYRLLNGQWEFNHFNTYSNTTFNGSF